MRINKEPEERKAEILDAAEELFLMKGFDGTSTRDILEKVGIARGTLYYHFKSKEDIMDALIERIHDRLVKAARLEAGRPDIPVKQRIINVVKTLRIGEDSEEVIMDHIHQPQNALLHQKIQNAILSGITPVLEKLIREGIEQELFDTPYPYECMEMAIVYLDTIFGHEMTEFSHDGIEHRVKAFIFNLERLLGVREGDLQFTRQLFDDGSENR